MTEGTNIAKPSKLSDEIIRQFFDHVGQHLVCLAFQLVDFDDKGNPKEMERFLACSGFVMSFKSMWFFVTAGHVLKELDEGIKTKRIAITNCSFGDYFGKGAKVKIPTPFAYEDATKEYIDDDEIGLDVGLIYLREIYREGFKANGILPISEAGWIYQDQIQFDKYYLLGFPKELVDEVTLQVMRGAKTTGIVPTMAIPLRRITNPDEIPSTIQIPEAKLGWFLGQLATTNIPDIQGMSGGPIVGLRLEPNGGYRYWFVAIQSAWYKESRIIRGCPLPIFAALVTRLIEENGITEENIQA